MKYGSFSGMGRLEQVRNLVTIIALTLATNNANIDDGDESCVPRRACRSEQGALNVRQCVATEQPAPYPERANKSNVQHSTTPRLT
jgi:hypothetical protein